MFFQGGRESKTYGVDVGTGRVLYECSMSKCNNQSQSEAIGDVIVIQRQTQTVRAIEPRSGVERCVIYCIQCDVTIISASISQALPHYD